MLNVPKKVSLLTEKYSNRRMLDYINMNRNSNTGNNLPQSPPSCKPTNGNNLGGCKCGC